MPIHFRCPHCDKLLALGTRQGGTQIHCPMCDRVITVPPRTEMQVPTTTVVLPDVGQAWWLDAPAELPPRAEPPPSPPPTVPSPPTDAWWLTAHEPPSPPEKALTTAAESKAPPLLQETNIALPISEPAPNPLIFESAAKTEAAARETIPPVEQPRSKRASITRSFSPTSILLIVLGIVTVTFAVVLGARLASSDSTPQPDHEEPADADSKKDDNPSSTRASEPQPKEQSIEPAKPRPFVVIHRRETTEEELRQEAARFDEVSLDRGDDRTEAQRVQSLAAAAEREGTKWDFGEQILKQRTDLAGLPLRSGEESRLSATAIDRLQSAALALRARLFQAAKGGGDVDTAKLRRLLDAGDAPREKWQRPEAIPALQQLLMGESASLREVLVDLLAHIDGPQASVALARTALFDLHPDVRRRALEALTKRDRRHYQQVLLDGLAYPWPAVADHAAEALVALDRREAVPALLRLLDKPNPAAPYKNAGKEELYVRDVVRINHLHNCLLCHAPSLKESGKLRGFVPSVGQPVPPPFTREYYGARKPGQFVRADVAYFQQDFSVSLPVAKHGKWPRMQRFDFLVSERPARNFSTRSENAHQNALLFALRRLTGADVGPAVEDWKRWAEQRSR